MLSILKPEVWEMDPNHNHTRGTNRLGEKKHFDHVPQRGGTFTQYNNKKEVKQNTKI